MNYNISRTWEIPDLFFQNVPYALAETSPFSDQIEISISQTENLTIVARIFEKVVKTPHFSKISFSFFNGNSISNRFTSEYTFSEQHPSVTLSLGPTSTYIKTVSDSVENSNSKIQIEIYSSEVASNSTSELGENQLENSLKKSSNSPQLSSVKDHQHFESSATLQDYFNLSFDDVDIPRERRRVKKIVRSESDHEQSSDIFFDPPTNSESDSDANPLINSKLLSKKSINSKKKSFAHKDFLFDSIPKEEKSSNSPYVGLINQGKTCYMNAFLQSLFHIPIFRRLIYMLSPENPNNPNHKIGVSLQILFGLMQLGTKPIDTLFLTQSFGWDKDISNIQQDLEEFSRLLLDILFNLMKGSNVFPQNLLSGSYRSVVQCEKVNFKNQTIEHFYDIQLMVKGCSDVETSFCHFVEKEIIHQYNTGEFGLQDATKRIEFLNFPDILFLHLQKNNI